MNRHRVSGPAIFKMGTLIGLAVACGMSPTRGAGPTESAAFPPATRITLHLHQAKPEKIFAELSKQAGIELGTEPDDLWKDHKDPIDIDADGQPFWTVMQEVAKKTTLQIGTFEETGPGLSVFAQNEGNDLSGPSLMHEGFLTVVTGTYRNSTVDLTKNGEVKRLLSVDLGVYPDPKWRVMESTSFLVTEAVDDKGQSLVGEPGSDELSKSNQWPISEAVRLKCPDVPGKKISSLKGSIKLRLVTKTQRIEIADPVNSKAVRKSVGKCDIVFKPSTHDDNGIQFPFTVSSSGGQSDEGLKQLGDSAIHLVYPDGKAAMPLGYVFDDSKGKRQFEFYPRQPEEGGKPLVPSKLILDVPLETVVVALPFEFKDLPLPQ